MDSWTHSFAPEYTMGPGLDFDRLPCSFGGNFFRRDLPEEIPDQPSCWNFYDRASCAHRVRDYIRGSLEEREESAFLLKYRSPALTADREIHA